MKKIIATRKMLVLIFMGAVLGMAAVSMVSATQSFDNWPPFQMTVRVREEPKPGVMNIPIELEIVRFIIYWEHMEKDKYPVTWLRCRVNAITDVIDSKAEDVEIEGCNKENELKEWDHKPRQRAGGTNSDILFPFETRQFQLKFKSDNGEYDIYFEIFDQEGHCVSETYYSFLIDKGRIYHAHGINGCIGQQTRERLGLSKKDLTDEERKKVQQEYYRIENKRFDIKQQRQKKPQSNREEKAPSPMGILNGQSIKVWVKWTGFQKSNVFPVINLKHATIWVIDTDNPQQQPLVYTLGDDGTCVFTTWKDDPHFAIRLRLENPGYQGSNAFCIKSNNPINSQPMIMELQIGRENSVDPTGMVGKTVPFYLLAPPGTSADDLKFFKALSVFQAYQEALRICADPGIGLNIVLKNPPLEVYFAAQNANSGLSGIGTFYANGTDPASSSFGPGIYIQSAYFQEWDGLLHELAHKIDDDYQVSAPIPPGFASDHRNQNMYIYTPNTWTFNNKQNALYFASMEGFADFFSVAMQEYLIPDYRKLSGVGDTIFSNNDLETRQTYRGEDSELDIAAVLLDLVDKNADSCTVEGLELRDTVSFGLADMWNKLKNRNIGSISEVWTGIVCNNTYPPVKGDFPDAASIFAAAGIAPLLVNPKDGEGWILDYAPGQQPAEGQAGKVD